jgi:hypothetical protein
VTFTNNFLIANTAVYRGAGLMAINCNPTIINSTLTRNRCTSTSTSATGAGICAYSPATISGRNNIVYDNFATTSPNYSGTVSFTYSCVQGGLSGQGNIGSNPLFVNLPPTGYCFLSQLAAGQSQQSPCVDAGAPGSAMVDGSTRTDMVPDVGTVDMGFHWVHTLTDALPDLRLEDDTELGRSTAHPRAAEVELRAGNHPNPFNPSTVITLEMTASAPVELTILDVSGRTIRKLHQGILAPGSHDFLFDGINLPAGVYLYRAESAGKTVTGKALLIK